MGTKPSLEIQTEDRRVTTGTCSQCHAENKVPADLQRNSVVAEIYLRAWFGTHECERRTMKCPYCGEETSIGTAAMFDTVFMSRKQCEGCKREFLIVNDIPMTEAQYAQSKEY